MTSMHEAAAQLGHSLALARYGQTEASGQLIRAVAAAQSLTPNTTAIKTAILGFVGVVALVVVIRTLWHALTGRTGAVLNVVLIVFVAAMVMGLSTADEFGALGNGLDSILFKGF